MKNEQETYVVRFDIKDPNSSYWKMNQEEIVLVATPLSRIKNNHDAARKIIQEKYPGCKVRNVMYV